MLAATNWTVLGVGIVTAMASVVGGAAGAWVSTRHELRAEDDRRNAAARSERRDAYSELLVCIDSLKSRVDGAAFLPGTPTNLASSEVTRPLLVAGVTVEILAGPTTWDRMKPLRDAVIAQANLTAMVQRGGALELISELRQAVQESGGDSPEGWGVLRTEYLQAARDDLAT